MAYGGRWHTEYELLDEPESGPHTLYHNKDGEVTSDNIRRAEKKKEKAEQAKNNHYPLFGNNGNGSNGFGSNDNGCNEKGGNNNKTLQINTENKSCHIDSNQNPYQQEVMEQYPMEHLKELYRANDLILMGVSDADVEMAMDILYDAVNTTKKTIRVNREDKPSEVVRSRLLKLRCMDILYAIEQYHKQTTEIRYQKAYMLSVLYDARGQGHLDYSNQVQHDLYGHGRGGG